MRPIRIALYGDVNLNIIDGSAIWLASLVQVLQRIAHTEQTVLRKVPEQRDVVTAGITGLPRVRLVTAPHARGPLTPDAALDEIERLDRERRFDVVLLRGYDLCSRAARRPRLAGRLWVYLTDIPQDHAQLTDRDRRRLARIAASSERLLCQTEALRSYLEGVAGDVAGKTVLLPPMVPPLFVASADGDAAGSALASADGDAAGSALASADGDAAGGAPGGADADGSGGAAGDAPRRARRLFYAGKFAPQWGFLETVAAFTALRRRHPDLELHVAGDKIHNPPDDPGYKPAVEAALTGTEGLVWHGGVTRAEVARLLREVDIALSARHRDLDDSLELSTKVLEYGAAGVPVVLNRLAMHVDLFGDDYPLYVDDLAGLADVLDGVLAAPPRWRQARARVRAVAERFTFDEIAAGLGPHLERCVPRRRRTVARAPRVVVASHSLKFFGALQDHLRRCGADIRVDAWEGHARHDEAASKELLGWADVIVCEWALGNALWYARNRRSGQRLVVRLHRMELDTEFPAELPIDAVDRVVFVSDLFRRKAVAQLAWPIDKLEVYANWVDTLMLDRPKLPGARFNLGMLGWIPIRKRLDRALDTLEHLAAADPRWRLYLGGPLPWQVRWVWQRLDERQYFTDQLERINASPVLRRAVSFDGHQRNVASWLRKIGFVLSPSDDESFHLAPAEGMASGAVPVVWPWECAHEVYDRRWIHSDAEAAAEAIATTDWEHERQVARRYVRAHYALEPVADAWADLVLGHASA